MKLTTVIASTIFFVFVLIPVAFASGPGFSGITANADTAETVVTNPAGMTRLKQPSFYANALIIASTDESEITASGTGQKETLSGDSTIPIPAIYYAHPLNDRWSIGIGPNGVGGLGTSYGDDWAGRYLLNEWSLTFVGIAPSVAYQVNDKFSVGASVPIMYSMYTLEKAVHNIDPEAGDGSFKLEADGLGAGLVFGILYEFTASTRVGLVYRSKVSVTEEGTPEFSDLTEERTELLNRFGVLNQDISVDTGVPQTVTAGIFHDFQNDWSFSFDAMWIDFSEWGLENVKIGDSEIETAPTNYKDIWGVTLGVNREIAAKWVARGGVFYLSSALDDEDRTLFSRFDQMWGVGLGCEYKINLKHSVTLDLTYLQFGEGKFMTQDAPVVGDISGKYTTNYAFVGGIGFTF